jgi:hypothetical protein
MEGPRLRSYEMQGVGTLPDEFYRDLLQGREIVQIDQAIYTYIRNRFAVKRLFDLRDRFGVELYRSSKNLVWAEFFIKNGEYFMRPGTCMQRDDLKY